MIYAPSLRQSNVACWKMMENGENSMATLDYRRVKGVYNVWLGVGELSKLALVTFASLYLYFHHFCYADYGIHNHKLECTCMRYSSLEGRHAQHHMSGKQNLASASAKNRALQDFICFFFTIIM